MGVLTQYETDIGGLDSALVNKIGTAPLTTAASDLSGAVNELDAELGNETLPDSSKTVKGNINSLKQSLSQKVNMVRLSANLTINYADAASIGYRTTEATKIDVTGLTGYPTGKTVLGCLAWGNDIYGSIIWVDNSNYLRGASKTSATIAVNIIVLYLD